MLFIQYSKPSNLLNNNMEGMNSLSVWPEIIDLMIEPENLWPTQVFTRPQNKNTITLQWNENIKPNQANQVMMLLKSLTFGWCT